MKFLCILVAVLAIAFGVASLEESKVCKPHSRPWQVRIQSGSNSCSGVLIDKWWIITSFSCAPLYSSAVATLGEHDVATAEGTEQRISVAQVIPHSPYRSPLHSLAMVRLSQPAQFTQYVQPLALPSRCPQPGDTCSVSGWGSTVPNQNEPLGLLKCLTVSIVDRQTCERMSPIFAWSNGMVCAGSAQTDNCLSDSGAVLECDGQLQGVQWYDYGCSNSAYPSVYTKMCLYNQWVNNVMDRNSPTTTTARPTTTAANLS